jgi:flagella synthesis protein FlgN
MRLDGAAVSRALQDESAALRTLVALLRDEQHALVYGEIEQIGLLAEPKAQSLFELSRLGAARERMLAEYGLAADRTGMQSFLSNPDFGAIELEREWRELLALTQSAHQINAINGTLIATRLGSTHQALNTLLGAARLPETYTPEGSTVSFRAARPRAVA